MTESGINYVEVANEAAFYGVPLGTHERFIGFLIECYADSFPLRLAPDQSG